MPMMMIRVMDEDLEMFNQAAIQGGFYRVQPDKPNRSAWALEVLRTVAKDVLAGVDNPKPGSTNDAGSKQKTGKTAHKSRAKRAATSR